MEILRESFGIEIRVIKAGRPMANGQAESAVKNLKSKMKLLSMENAEKFGDNWDGTVLHNALQILRCDPSSATGFSPAELIMGRPVVYPFELRQSDIDFSGVLFTVPMVQSLQMIHDLNFGSALQKIEKAQAKYKRDYDKRNQAKKFNLQIGDKVQYMKYRSKKNKTFPPFQLLVSFEIILFNFVYKY